MRRSLNMKYPRRLKRGHKTALIVAADNLRDFVAMARVFKRRALVIGAGQISSDLRFVAGELRSVDRRDLIRDIIRPWEDI